MNRPAVERVRRPGGGLPPSRLIFTSLGGSLLFLLLAATGLVVSTGCSSSTTVQDAIDGRVDIDASDAAALADLLAASSIDPGTVLLVRQTSAQAVSLPSTAGVGVAQQRVVALRLNGVVDAEAVGKLEALRRLDLEGRFERLDLQLLHQLETLDVLSQDRQLASLLVPSAESPGEPSMKATPALGWMTVHGADFGSGLELGVLPRLTVLSLTDCRLIQLPMLDAPGLRELTLGSNRLSGLRSLGSFEHLERLDLSANNLESVHEVPSLPALRRLSLAGNPLSIVDLDVSRWPSLGKLDLKRTGTTQVPAALAEIERLDVEIDAEHAQVNELAQLLARLRASHRSGAGESAITLATRLDQGGGTIKGSSGKCRWHTSSFERARVNCRFDLAEVRGMAAVHLGETDPALPFAGGGTPQLKVTLSVDEGSAAVYVRHRFDLVQTASTIIGAELTTVEALAEPQDRFDGYRRALARPGSPVTVEGEPSILGSRVVLWIESVNGSASGVALSTEPKS